MTGVRLETAVLAAVWHGPGRLVVETVPRPAAPAGGLLLAVRACAVCGSDVRIAAHGHHKITPPQILGHEVVGTIVESRCALPVGRRVTVAPALGCGACRWCAAGRPNRCAGLTTLGYEHPGAFAEYLPVPAAAVAGGHVTEVPATLPDEVACLTEPLACCLNGQELAGVGPGDQVVIVGLGPIGWLHARLATARGATPLLLERQPGRRRLAAAAGLGELLEATGDVTRRIRAATGGQGADVVIVAAPAAEVQAAAIEWLAPGGRLSWFGGLPPETPPIAVASNRVHYAELTIVGAHGSTPEQNRRALALLATGELDPAGLVTHRFALPETPAAVAAMASGEALKAVVRPAGQDS